MVKVKTQPAGGETATATEEPAKKEKAEKVKRKKRADFPAGDEGWRQWCEYNKQRILSRIVKQQERAELWEKKKAGEHLDKQAKKLRRIEKLKKQLASLETELKAAGIDPNAPQG